MRVIIDLQVAQGSNRHTAIARYGLDFVRSLAMCRGHHEVFVGLSSLFPDSIESIRSDLANTLPGENVFVWHGVEPTTHELPMHDVRRRSSELVREAAFASLSPDLVIILSLLEEQDARGVASIGSLSTSIPTFAVIFSLSSVLDERPSGAGLAMAPWYEARLGHLRRADLILAVSQAAQMEAGRHLAVDSIVIAAPPSGRFARGAATAMEAQALERDYGVSRSFILYADPLCCRADVEGMIAAFAKLPIEVREAHQLAIVCETGAEDRARLLELGAGLGLSASDLVLHRAVADEDWPAWYRACALFVSPGWHGPQGVAAREAMQCGRTVIASAAAPRSGAALRNRVFDEIDADSLSRDIARALVDVDFRGSLERAGLDAVRQFDEGLSTEAIWLECQRRVAEIGVRKDRSPQVRRRRLVFVYADDARIKSDRSTPNLLKELTRFYEIDAVSTANDITDPEIVGNCSIRDLSWFRANAARCERVVYQIGGTPNDFGTVSTLNDHPGLVILQDFSQVKMAEHRDTIGDGRKGVVRAIVQAHGWASAMRYRPDAPYDDGHGYPCNLDVLRAALGVIVHREHDRALAMKWYGARAADEWSVIPVIRGSKSLPDTGAARGELGVGDAAFVVCCFGGGSNATGDTLRVLEAWLASPFARDPESRLVFLGVDEGDGEARRRARAARSGRIEFCDHTIGDTYTLWLASADVAIVLSGFGGRADAAVLDCVDAEVPIITRRNGLIDPLPNGCGWILEDHFGDADLIGGLNALRASPGERREMARRAQAQILSKHAPGPCADAYVAAIEACYARAATGEYGIGHALLAADLAPSKADLVALAEAISRTLAPRPQTKRIFVDVSELAQRDSKSGIQRVVRSILMQWLLAPPSGWLIEPVYAEADRVGYRYARAFTAKFLGLAGVWTDDLIEPTASDIFVGLDLQSHVVPRQRETLEEWHRSGMKIYFVLYDLLPVTLSHYFVEGTKDGHQLWLDVIAQFNGVIGISRAVADEFCDWLGRYGPNRARGLELHWFHLGADMESSVPTKGLPDDAPTVLASIRAAPSFLSVGTIEPRKGHRQTLAAFEILWSKGLTVNLVLVGQLGWMMDDFAAQVRESPYYGVRLFWLRAISDEYLDAVYNSCGCLVAASEGEGFGLPLIEASRHGIPVIARDIPVFREVGGDVASYFVNDVDPAVISGAVERFLEQGSDGARIQTVAWSTWSKSAQSLLATILGESPPYRVWRRDGHSDRGATVAN
ncbi:glycosyltransferase [Sphingomonas glacialis]|nr:glycosyltransferase [Sphingomonas glacialis]